MKFKDLINKEGEITEVEDSRVEVSPLKYDYYKLRDELIKEEDAMNINKTDDFKLFLETEVKTKGIINIAIVGDVGGGKSTGAIAIMNDINEIIEKIHNKKINRLKSIFSDQTEFLRFISSDTRDVCVVIDEFSRMAETGFNATTEIALFNYYSDVFAQKFMHRISCSPSVVMDMNCNVILTFLGKDIEKEVSKFKLEYRSSSEGFRKITLGHVDIDVSKVLHTDFYKEYRKKKFERMDLLDKHGVRDIRELEFSEITLATYNELKDVCSDINKGDLSDMILATISRVMRERKRIYSSLTTTEIQSRCKNLLSIKKAIIQTQRKVKKEIEKPNEGISEVLRQSLQKQAEILNKELDEEERKFKIYKEYLRIE